MPDQTPVQLDAQTIELLGTSYVRMQLQRDGVDVAEPARDRGIDLIAYLDRGQRTFCARPIQVKASLEFRWIHSRKYAAFPGLIMTHVMHLRDEADTVVYATSYAENHAIAQHLGYLESALWTNPANGHARVWKQSARGPRELVAALEPYRVTAGTWQRLISGSLVTLPERIFE